MLIKFTEDEVTQGEKSLHRKAHCVQRTTMQLLEPAVALNGDAAEGSSKRRENDTLQNDCSLTLQAFSFSKITTNSH